MKILIISYYFPPINSIASLRPYSWAKYWSQMGHEVTVLTASEAKKSNDLNIDCSLFNMIRITNPLKNLMTPSITEGSIQINCQSQSKPTFLRKFKTFLQSRGIMSTARMPDFNDVVIAKSVDAISSAQFDFIISTAGPYTEHLIAHKIMKKQKQAFWIADYRDLWTQNHIFKGLFPFTWIEEYLEKKINHSADYITTVSQPLADQISHKYTIDNVAVIENGFDTDDTSAIAKEPYWSDNKVRLVYTGVIYRGKQDPSPLLEAIQIIDQSEYSHLLQKLEVIFVGGAKGDLHEFISKYGVDTWVKDHGFVSRDDALRMQRDAHGLIFLEFEAPGVDGILTGKLFEYLDSGTEILGIGVTDKNTPGKLIAESEQGRNFGTDSQKIATHLKNLLEKQSKPVITKNTECLKKYSRQYLAEKLISIVTNSQTNIGNINA